MNDISDLAKIRRRKKLVKFSKNALGICVVLACMLLVFYMRLNFSDVAVGDVFGSIGAYFSDTQRGFPISLSTNRSISFEGISNRVLTLTDTDVKIISGDGRVLKNVQHALFNPRIRTKGDKYLIYDRGGKKFEIGNVRGTSRKGETEFTIVTGDVSRHGKTILCTESLMYTSLFIVYNEKGEEYFKWNSTEGKIISAAFMPDGSGAVAALLMTDGGRIVSGVEFLDFSKTETGEILLRDTMILKIFVRNNGSVVVVGDNETVILTPKGDIAARYGYDGRNLISFAVSDHEIALAFSKNAVASDTIGVILNDALKERGTFEVQGEPKLMRFFDNKLYFLETEQLFLFQTDGELYKTYDTGFGIRDIYEADGKLLLLSPSEVLEIER